MILSDESCMRRALELAEGGRGFVEPNPLVGAVVVRNERMVGEGRHERFGEAHAEVNALAAAGAEARHATLYVTLEPCCHHGKTPPCTDAVLRSGVRRVVAAMRDPFPAVSGKGIAVLQAAGIDVTVGVCESEARRLNAPYLKLIATGRPYVHAKWAMTLDGKIATRTGDSKWISNEASRRRTHELRGRMDAIIVGIGTVLADDPLLTARPPGPRRPVRIVLDSRGRTPISSQLVRTAKEISTVIAVADADAKQLEKDGCEILKVRSESGRVSVTGLLEELGRRRMTNVLVEGGAGVLGAFLDAGEIDEAHVFIAPRLLGGQEAKSPVGGIGALRIAEALAFAWCEMEDIDGDVLIHCRRA
jgi:diaminohydroxyphosphoribosylaminopyrimidine deaminase/5-amino-6-(5-phosphoribosylamino)uracil reductase